MSLFSSDVGVALKWSQVCAMSVAALILSGCDHKPVPPPPPTANSPAPVVNTPPPASTAPVTPSPSSSSNAVMPNMSLQCEDFATVVASGYMIENNTWGKGEMSDWRQCVGLTVNTRGGVAGLWNWDWKNQGDQVKAYPEVVFGHKPGYPKSTTPLLPRQLKDVQTVQLDYDVNSQRQGSGNLSLDIWFTNTPTPTSFSVPTITHEVMIWLDVEGTMYAGGSEVEETTINGVPYKVFVGENFGMGWRYIAFTPVHKTKASVGSLDLLSFFNYLRGKQWLANHDWLAAINFGNEIISGSGETRLYHFAVTIK